MAELIYRQEVYQVVGAAMEVYNTLGPGFLEPVYQEALAVEMEQQGIPFDAQKELRILYKGRPLEKTYCADFLTAGCVIVEIKAIEHLGGREEAQLLNYLKATHLHIGVLINFGAPHRLEWKRMVMTRSANAHKSTNRPQAWKPVPCRRQAVMPLPFASIRVHSRIPKTVPSPLARIRGFPETLPLPSASIRGCLGGGGGCTTAVPAPPS